MHPPDTVEHSDVFQICVHWTIQTIAMDQGALLTGVNRVINYHILEGAARESGTHAGDTFDIAE